MREDCRNQATERKYVGRERREIKLISRRRSVPGIEVPTRSLRQRGIVRAISLSLLRWCVYQRTMSDLHRLSERELEDLGIERHKIRAAAWYASDPCG